ncbi:hypothetical protein CSUI_003890 [Cystoisospora suis]|uniref:Uncharacterized protein n=1 Tax=Cystoisospora suis TaxID=483139 RepID=A0A2C6KE23_9APIC|nr:hypothetical protein CSUI_003890 [Cystoisospora suis]
MGTTAYPLLRRMLRCPAKCLYCLLSLFLVICCASAGAFNLPGERTKGFGLEYEQRPSNPRPRPGAAAAAAARDGLQSWWQEMQDLFETTAEGLRGAAEDIHIGNTNKTVTAGDLEEKLERVERGAADLMGHFRDFLAGFKIGQGNDKRGTPQGGVGGGVLEKIRQDFATKWLPLIERALQNASQTREAPGSPGQNKEAQLWRTRERKPGQQVARWGTWTKVQVNNVGF